jgi:hypothetical protein
MADEELLLRIAMPAARLDGVLGAQHERSG